MLLNSRELFLVFHFIFYDSHFVVTASITRQDIIQNLYYFHNHDISIQSVVQESLYILGEPARSGHLNENELKDSTTEEKSHYGTADPDRAMCITV